MNFVNIILPSFLQRIGNTAAPTIINTRIAPVLLPHIVLVNPISIRPTRMIAIPHTQPRRMLIVVPLVEQVAVRKNTTTEPLAEIRELLWAPRTVHIVHAAIIG